MNDYHILVVEDERNIRNFIKTILTSNNYTVLTATTGEDAMTLLSSRCPDLVLLDLGLPDTDGQMFIQAVRRWSQVPILVVSARSHERDKVMALDFGADDYITKPFGTSELLARVRAALRHAAQRSSGQQISLYHCRDLTVDAEKRRVQLSGSDIHLTQNEYKIVSLLARYAGKVLTYDQIIQHVWGPNAAGDNRILRVNMANIRRKLEANPAEPQYIFTEIGVGYRMAEGE
ncbi:MAG TPA: response regulator transcription factor [Candidatus Avoscillospira avicola]|uniref:Stage 0 sporulation protein A homolog n=1 Tax=Candidatus Avoscillospira avicola TaxID=2840706 RepID=A0A9D1IXF3_9FIRM|nr:response regulator transcription factor [Candidatus Avoscillospira avicola]